MTKYKITSIVWDTDEEEVDLPVEFEISAESEDALADAISDKYGWCHHSFQFEEVREVHTLVITKDGVDRQYSFHLGTDRAVALQEGEVRARAKFTKGAERVTLMQGDTVVRVWPKEEVS